MDIHSSFSRNNGPGLYEFLMEAELQQYYSGIRGDLKVQNTAQLKYVTEEDLTTIGMSKPEMRRLKKYFQKHFPQNYLSKFKKMLLSKREENIPDTLSILSEERPERPPIRVPNKHMIPADAIIVNKELGTGEFGVVQQGVWTNDGERIQVAIKCLSRERMQNNPIEFLKEAAIMHTIDHEHIVRLYGVVLDTNSLMLVTELAPLRSLLECLKEPSLRASFPVSSLCDFAVQIADGMQYLEAKRLIHRDLAARNILVFSKNKVKISDFGLSRALGVGKDYYQTNFNVNLKLPIAWCAPECISYLKFTSASDVWAYGVTLWEMFSYGFQPWAALTGHQILEAIDEPNFQRLEQPECCPKDYFTLMLQCWQHEPAKRPKFSELINLLPDLKPEQVQAVQDCNEVGQLMYRQGDVITVLDKASNNTMWKGVLNNGKTGFFNPAHTIAYLGSNLPSNKPAEFTRGDGKNAFSSQRRKIRTDMISSPQGDLKHTGHVGLDGAYFGDVSFLAGKYPHLPRQVVTPYKPQEDITDNSSQQISLERRNTESERDFRERAPQPSQSDVQNKNEGLWSDACSETSHIEAPDNIAKQSMNSCMVSSTDTIGPDHEYHEISDEENQDSPLRFDKPLSFDFGPSLLDEMDQMFKSLGSSPLPQATNHPLSSEHESSNARNELREMQAKQSSKKKQATVSPINVKPISAADQKTLYSAIAMAQELTARSMTDLEHPLESPRTPASPSRRRKFSFKLPHQHSPKPDRRHFAEEAASIPDIQWLCSSLQSLSSTVSSIESLGAPSTLKLPLWDKASAEFCFAKSRELLTKPSAWTSYMDAELDARILDSASSKQSLAKSTEYLEARSRKSISNCESTAQKQNGKLTYENAAPKRVSASYVDRYFDQSGYFDDDLDMYMRSVTYLDQEKIDKMNNLERSSRASFYSNFQEFAANASRSSKINESMAFAFQNGLRANLDSPAKKTFGTRPKVPNSLVDAKMNINSGPGTLRVSRNSYQESPESLKTAMPDSPRVNAEAVRVNLPSLHKCDNQNGQDNFPYVISNNPLFEADKKEKNLDLGQKLLVEKYHRDVSALDSVKNYFEARKEEGLLDLENVGPTSRKPPRLKNLDLFGVANPSMLPNLHILEPPKLYQNDNSRKDAAKLPAGMYRQRTSSLSESRKQQIRSARNSFHPRRDSSDESDSISHSETDIRSRLRQRRRHKRMHNFRLNFKSKAYFLHPDSAKGALSVELCGKSPPPSTSFLNSLSPPFPSRNNLLSWPESAPSSSLTFTSNSDLDSDTSSEYPEFANDTFPPSPAP